MLSHAHIAAVLLLCLVAKLSDAFAPFQTCAQHHARSLQRALSKGEFHLCTMAIKSPQVVAIVPEGADSFFASKPFREPIKWLEVMRVVAEKMTWESKNQRFDASNGELSMHVMTMEEARSNNSILQEAPVVLLVGLDDVQEAFVKSLGNQIASAAAVAVFECAPAYASLARYGDFIPPRLAEGGEGGEGGGGGEVDWVDALLAKWDGMAKNKRSVHRASYEVVQEVWLRKSSEDILFLVLVLINTFANIPIKTVQAVTSTDNTGLDEARCMASNCSEQMINCFKSEQCRQALDCLNKCRSNDQVCAYRCITSYESKEFEAFAQCILQKNNCMGNTATIPAYPDPLPMTHFRGKELSFRDAEGIFEGHLAPRASETNALLSPSESEAALEQWSWKVVCGVNPAYDYFSDQHQIFYRDKLRKSVMWYDPVFKVTTLAGQEVWRRRHYRVRRAAAPGQFRFTVLDNGVLSDEYWRILDCADDLRWAVFYYGGAASAAGTSYTGALVVTKSGKWPENMTKGSETARRIEQALLKGGISLWEVFEVTNTLEKSNNSSSSSSNAPPLGIM